MFHHGPRFTRFFAALCFLLAVASSSAQTTIRVPADRTTIQAGIDAANYGDVVLVAPGTYNENIDFKGKTITVTSEATSYSDAVATVINAATGGPVVKFATGETAATVFNGFTIQGGFYPDVVYTLGNAGIWIHGASPSVTNNIVRRNIGCGILVDAGASPSIAGNDIRENRAPFLTEILSNLCGDAAVAGTGLAINYAGNVTVTGNTVEYNMTGRDNDECPTLNSPGIAIYQTNEAVLTGNTIRNNVSPCNDPGMYSGYDGYGGTNTLIMVQNRFYSDTSAPTGSNSYVAISGNLTQPYPKAVLINNTFADGGGVGDGLSSDSLLENNIYYQGDPKIRAFECAPYATIPTVLQAPLVSNDIYGLSVLNGCSLGNGSLAADPLFVKLAGGDLHTQPTSPVIYAGDINAPDLPPTDLDGKNRTVCGKIDMGVYQHHPHPSIALAAAPNPTPGRSAVTLTATLTGNCNTPTGTVTFFDGATALGTATLSPGAVASFTTSFLFVGTHTLTATYPGDFNFEDGSSNAVTEVITGPPTTTVLTSVTPNPALPYQAITMAATVGSAYTVPQGTMTFFAGATALATVPVAGNGGASAVVSTLGAGTYAITARYGGSTEYGPSTSNAVALVVLAAPSVTTLIAQPNPVYQGQTVTLAASTAGTSPNPATPTGTFTFYDGAALLGTAPLTGGHVTFDANTLSVGSHTLTAVYSGDANYAPSTSQAVIEVVLASSFTIGLSPANLAFAAGQPQQVTVNLGSVGNYTGTLQLGAGALPQYASASFSPTTVALTAGGAATSRLTLSTTAPLVRAGVERGPVGLLSFAALAGLPLLLLRRVRRLPNLLAVLFVCAAIASLAGCGSVRFAADSVAPGTYVIPITATDAQTGISQTAMLTLQITR